MPILNTKGSIYMPIKYKINVISALKDAGYSTYRLRKEKLLGEATIQKFRNSEPVSWDNISTVCKLLQCQIGDLLEYVSDEDE
jgi:putative transcriptional regulator